MAAASLFFRGGESSPRCVTASTLYVSVYLQHWLTHTFTLHVGWGAPTSSLPAAVVFYFLTAKTVRELNEIEL